jgi:hypothetical protein
LNHDPLKISRVSRIYDKRNTKRSDLKESKRQNHPSTRQCEKCRDGNRKARNSSKPNGKLAWR